MKNIKFNDWQEMALKKDTETIIKKLNKPEFSTLALCWEFFLVLIASIADHLIDINDKMWAAMIIILGMIPLIFFVAKNMHWLVSALKRVKSGKYDIKGMVDTFDNQICYWVMMCNSYCNLLSTNTENKNERIFLYQEGCYYNNKSIEALYRMKPVIDKVFSENSQTVGNNNVAVYRLSSLLKMMNQHQLDLDCYIEDYKDDTAIKGQMKTNDEYKNRIIQFIDDVNKIFENEKIKWKEKDQ